MVHLLHIIGKVSYDSIKPLFEIVKKLFSLQN